MHALSEDAACARGTECHGWGAHYLTALSKGD
ncbi:hypothetical protein [Pseudomonas farris]